MQTSLTAWKTQNLFSPHYIENRLENTQEWKDLEQSTVDAAFNSIANLFEEEMPELVERNEMPLEERFIRPVLQVLNHHWEVQQAVHRNRRTPDYALFGSDSERQKAVVRKQEGEDVYKNAIGIADAKHWDRDLDVENNDQRDFGNPNYQISYYLQETPPDWGIVTNGRKWRLYYAPTSHKLNSFFEVDLPTILKSGDLRAFTVFYVLFRRQAFCPDVQGECFLDRVYQQSARFSRELGEDIQDRIYDALKVLAQGFLHNDENNLDADDIDYIHDASLVYLYRLIFILYAESEERSLLPIDSKKYERDYSLNQQKITICEELEKDYPKYRDYEFGLWEKLDRLFRLIDKGSDNYNIPETDFHIPGYNGGLFRTNPSKHDRSESRFLQDNRVADSYLAEVIRLISQTDVQTAGEHQYADYSSLTVRHLGSIYEGLLEYDLGVATEPLVAIDDGEREQWVPQSDFEGNIEEQTTIRPGEVYLKTTGREEAVIRSYKPAGNERKEFGSYYTPEYVVKYIVEDSLDPVLEDIKEDVRNEAPPEEYADRFMQRVFDLSILDPAMGSGHFLTGVVDYLAAEILEAREQQVDDVGVESLSENMDSEWVRRRVAQRCIYGIDVQPMAVELAKVSLWLNTLAAERPLAFLDHHLKCGNSLVGSNLEEIDELPIETDDEQSSWASWGTSHKEAVEHVIEIFRELLDIEMEARADVKKMETKYQEITRDETYQRILSICDVHTAKALGVDIGSGQIENLARVIEDDEQWESVTSESWYQDAISLDDKYRFFHWYLEFPQVFYGDAEDELGSPGGFDVVLGNPPYGSVDDDLTDYFEAKYRDTAEYFIDMFALFIEKGLSLLQENGQFGYIIPQQWLTQPNAEGLREFVLSNSWLRSIIRFEERVFEGVDVDTIILMAEKSEEPGVVNAYMADNSENDVPMLEKVRSTDQDALLENEDYRIEIRRTPAEQRILDKIRDVSVELEPRVAEVRIGIQVYNKSKHDEETRKTRDFHSETKESDNHFLEIKGRHVERYHLDPAGAEYLKVGDHLHDPIPRHLCSGPRILLQEITNESRDMLNAAYTESEYCFDKSVLGITTHSNYSTHFILAVLNSEVMSWIFPRISNKIISSFVTGSFPRIQVSDARRLPIPLIDFHEVGERRDAVHRAILTAYEHAVDNREMQRIEYELRGAARAGQRAAIHDAVGDFAQNLGEWYAEKARLNTDLLSYIEPFEPAGTLEEVAQPVAGLEHTVVTEKGSNPQYTVADFEIEEDHDGVRLNVLVESDGSSQVETIPVYRFRNPSELEVRLLEEYLPVVLEQSKSKTYAGFLPHTTTQNSVIDRLRGLELPELSAIETGFRQYVKEADREADLERKIATTEVVINEAICFLYGLTTEDQNVIEQGLQEQES